MITEDSWNNPRLKDLMKNVLYEIALIYLLITDFFVI